MPYDDEDGGIGVAFDATTMAETPDWTRLDVAPYRVVRSFEIARGRTREIDKTGTGTAGLETVDTAGLIDPTNPGSPFAGKLDPVKQARIQILNPWRLYHEATTEWSYLFRGYVDSWGPFEVDQSATVITGQVQLVDLLDLLAELRMLPGHGSTPPVGSEGDVYLEGGPNGYTAGTFKHVDDRLAEIADLLSIPTVGEKRSGLRDFFSGNVSVLEQVYARADQALSAFDDAVDAELPFVATRFVTKEGVLAFRGRFARYNPEHPGYGIGHWYLGGRAQADADPDTVVAINELPAFYRAAGDIVNAAIALPSGATDTDPIDNLVTDETSIGQFGYRSRNTESLLTNEGHNDDLSTTTPVEETRKFAVARVGNYSQPVTRVGQIVIRGRDPRDRIAGPIWDLICNVELNDLVTLTTSHPGGGGFDEDFFVESIRYRCAPAPAPLYYDIELTLEISPRVLYQRSNPFGEVDEGVS